MNERYRVNHRNVTILSCMGIGLSLVATLACPSPTTAADAKVAETARTAEAVVAVDDHWLQAEEHGDTAWLDSMLSPEYRSIGADGKILDKPTLLAHAARNRTSDKMSKEVQAWQKTHPTRKSVVMRADVAILSFSNPQTGRVRASDIFVYEGGAWHALYSQHTRAE